MITVKRVQVFASLVMAGVATAGLSGQEIEIDAHKVTGRVSRYLTGACIEDVNHEIYGGLYSQMVFGESFQEPAPAPSIARFRADGGRWLLHEGIIRVDAADGPKLVSERPAFKNGTVGAELRFAERKGVNAGLIVRVNDPGIGADRFVGYEVSLDAGRQRVVLARHRNNFEPIKETPCAVAVGRWIALEVRLAGTVVEIVVDGKSVLRHDDGERALAAGTVGLRGWHRTAEFRNLWLKTGTDVEPLPFKQSAEVPEVSGMWRPMRRGSAKGHYTVVTDRPFAGTQSQQLTFTGGHGAWGVENQGLNRWGMNLGQGKPYEGYLWIRTPQPATVVVALESRDGRRRYAEARLHVNAGEWQRVDFTLTPNGGDRAGRFAVLLEQPGAVTLGHAFLQPGAWGRFKGLPVRRDVAEGLIGQGITILRYGGSMVNNSAYRWKNMIGPRDRRPSYTGLWYRYSTNGWGIVDFMDFCEAAGFKYAPAFNIDETPEDMAGFIEYARGPADSAWGRKRVADGRAQPYRLRYIELGNEERIDEKYAARFAALAPAIWAKDPDLILVVGDFAYDHPIRDPMKFTGAASGITNLTGHAKILELARKYGREVWFDVHIWTEGPGASPSLDALPSYIDALTKVGGGARHKVVVFEYNSGNHRLRRALGNALATNRIERDGRVPIVTSANGLQPDGQNDNGWDQGLLFLNPSQVWLQPPGYVTQMLSRHYEPVVVACRVQGAPALDVTAKRSADGQTLIVQVVNVGAKPIAAKLRIADFAPTNPVAHVTELAGSLDAANSAAQSTAIVPHQSEWEHALKDGSTTRTFAAQSFTIIRWNGAPTKRK